MYLYLSNYAISLTNNLLVSVIKHFTLITDHSTELLFTIKKNRLVCNSDHHCHVFWSLFYFLTFRIPNIEIPKFDLTKISMHFLQNTFFRCSTLTLVTSWATSSTSSGSNENGFDSSYLLISSKSSKQIWVGKRKILRGFVIFAKKLTSQSEDMVVWSSVSSRWWFQQGCQSWVLSR